MSLMLANHRFFNRRFREAAEGFEVALRKRPDLLAARQKLVICYAHIHRVEAGLELATGLMREDPAARWDLQGEAVGYPGPELIYQIDLGATNQVQILLEPQTADLGVFLLSDCGNGLSCVNFFDAVGGGAVSLIAPGQTGVTVPGQSGTFDFAAASAGSHYIYIDSYYGTGSLSCGSYNLTVTGNLPVELMEFKVE